MKSLQLASPRPISTSRTSLSGLMRVSSNDALSALTQQPDLHQRSRHPVPPPGLSLPLVLPLLLLRSPLLHPYPRHRLPGPHRTLTERPPWSSTQVDSGI